MKFDGYAIVTDLDGTLFNRKQEVPERSICAIERFKNSGGLFTFATGRDKRFIDRRFCFLKDLVNAPAIMSNGALIYDFEQNRTYIDFTMDIDIFELLGLVNEAFSEVLFEIYTNDEIIVVNPDKHCDSRYTNMNDLVTYANSLLIPKSPAVRVVFIDRNTDRLNKVARFIEKLPCSKKFNLVFSDSFIFEILPKGASKGNGIMVLRNIFDKKVKIISAGDWSNDMSQLQAADFAVCPSNAKQEIRDFCKYTLCDCDDGIISDIVEKIENGQF